MSATPDKKLMQLAARHSYKADPNANESWDVLRQKNTEVRQMLVGRHADEVMIEDSALGRRFVPRFMREGTRRIILFIHGGGWVNCNVITHSSIMTDLAAVTGCELVALSYPFAPENPHPAALDAVCGKIKQIAHSEDCEIVLAGDSAGANLALAAALRLRDEKATLPIVALLLYYGCYRRKFDTRSHLAYGDGTTGLATDWMSSLWGFYLPDGTNPTYAELSDADFSGLPAAYLCEAECDCLADDTRWLASRLVDANVSHYYDFYPSVLHGFLHFSKDYDPSYQAIRAAGRFLSMFDD
ncbi:alpha/beta hydrolase [uncultured Cohaesibacter sp.]|uniref:alpha/beta hydrolase n=1 Tax=uncultured Cohaesibacter sp. TaxID=1002546 RepID=UPI00292FA2DD|nr:alpha/beta hydrolase [uncultured Cohaesibacter sp.]